MKFLFKQNVKIIVLALLLFSVCYTKNTINFSHITIEDGLPQNSVFAIIEDKNGFIWFGTEGGLCRFDGLNVKVYTTDQTDSTSLSNGFITYLFEDSKNNIWVGTRGGGLNKFNPNTEVFKTFTANIYKNTTIRGNAITTIFEDSQGVLWVGTRSGGLSKLVQENNIFINFDEKINAPDGLKKGFVSSIYEDKNNILWFGTRQNGLISFNRIDESYSTYLPFSDKTKFQASIAEINEDYLGRLWIATNNGLYLFNKEKRIFEYKNYIQIKNWEINTLNIIKFLLDKEKGQVVIWLATEGGGLIKYLPDMNRIYKYNNVSFDKKSISSNRVYSLLKSSSGVFYAGTRGGGLNTFIWKKKKFNSLRKQKGVKNSLVSNSIYQIFEGNDGLVFFGTGGKGLDIWDKKNNKFLPVSLKEKINNLIVNKYVWSIYQDSRDNYWFGSGGGVVRYNMATGAYKKFVQPENFNIFEDKKGLLWFANSGSGFTYSYKTDKMSPIKIAKKDSVTFANNLIFTSCLDKSGRIWFGLEKDGIFLFDKDKKEAKKFNTHKKGYKNISIKSVCYFLEDSKQRFWVATTDLGLCLLNRETGEFINFTTKNGFPNNTTYVAVEDKNGFIWVSSNLGLTKLNPDDFSIVNFDMHDGLQDNEFNQGAGMMLKSGEIIFGGINGITYFYPDSIILSKKNTKVIINDFKIFNESVAINKEYNGNIVLTKNIIETENIVLNYKDKIISFEFSALGVSYPKNIEFAYQVEGLDDDWNYIGRRRYITFSNISSGEYTLKIKATNDDGIWSKNIKTIQIIIKPPYWQTAWFRFLSVFILLSGIGGLYTLRIRSIQKQTDELETKVLERTQIIEEQKREIQEQLNEVKQLSGLLPICSNCHEIRDDSGYWHRVEEYFTDRSNVEFSHSLCPNCAQKLYPKFFSKEQNE